MPVKKAVSIGFGLCVQEIREDLAEESAVKVAVFRVVYK